MVIKHFCFLETDCKAKAFAALAKHLLTEWEGWMGKYLAPGPMCHG